MARIRYLKPEFFKDEDLAGLPFETRLFYAGLWGLADKAGRLEDRPKRLKAEIFPYDDVDVEKCLYQLSHEKNGSHTPFINRYVTDGQRYMQIIKWDEHQKPHHTEAESKIPPYTPLENFKGNGEVKGDGKAAQPESSVKQPLDNGEITVNSSTSTPTKETKSHKSGAAERIISAWQRLPLPEEKKVISGPGVLAVARAISILAGDSQEPIHEEMILEAIENYGKALMLPDSQTYKHKLYNWLMEHVRKYTSYAFDIEKHKRSNFDKKKQQGATLEEARAKGLI